MRVAHDARYLLVVGAATELSEGCLAELVDRSGYPFVRAADADAAIVRAARGRPALIVVGVGGPGNDIDSCRRLITAVATRDMPIVAIAGDAPDSQFMISLAVQRCDADTLDREIDRILARVH
jgi:CheY-like chemotaxis protein